MSRKEFLGQLERLLWDIPEQERKEALDYYRSYFDDAGEENESGVIQELGSPGKVAAIIKADLEENREEYGEYSEAGYTDERFDDRNMPDTRYASETSGKAEEENNWDGNRYRGPKEEEARGYDGPYRRAGYGGNAYTAKKGRSGLSWAVIMILLILTVPVWGGLGIGLLGAVVGIVFACRAVAAALLFGGLGLIAGGVAALVHTLIYQLATPAEALVTGGAALLLVAGGLLFILAFVWLAFKAFPVCFRWFVDFIQRMMHKGSMGGGRA